jgi:23S rRNA (uracil1939-C5)-methyltransferase
MPDDKLDKNKHTYEPGIGFHAPGSFSKVLDVAYCHLQPDPSNQIRLAVKQFCLDNEIPFFDNYNKSGVLRSLLVRNTVFTNQWMVLVMVYTTHPMLDSLMEYIRTSFPQITSLNYVINPKVNDTFYDLPLVLYSGEETISEELDGIRYRINPKSFFQTNSRQALLLFSKALDMAGINANDHIYDLYTGTGSLALMAARRARFVTGVELVPEAIADAYINARNNNIDNVQFFAGDMAKTLNPAFIETNGVPDLVITDPPRAGMVPKVVETILEMNAPRVLYISCNPATQARDVALMKEKYKVTAAQPVDMFPHTKHVENIVVLERV